MTPWSRCTTCPLASVAWTLWVAKLTCGVAEQQHQRGANYTASNIYWHGNGNGHGRTRGSIEVHYLRHVPAALGGTCIKMGSICYAPRLLLPLVLQPPTRKCSC